MKVSILDQSPVSAGKTAQDALHESLKLAQLGERLGYTRYWIAEHHDFPGLTCPAPEIMLGYIGGQTKTIRIGSGAVLLPHYKPYKVAESFNMLATLFPGRIDLGIGRAPGGSAEATMALSHNYLEKVRQLPDSLQELLQFLQGDFPSGHMYSKISPSPVPETSPVPWLLGTSKRSALLAAEKGLPYAYGQFMSDKDGTEIIEDYHKHFVPHSKRQRPYSLLAVSVICAATEEEAEEAALSGFIWKLQLGKGEGRSGVPTLEEAKRYPLNAEEEETLRKMREKSIVGSPAKVKKKLEEMKSAYHADELMVVTITHRYEDRLRSYELLAEAILQDEQKI